MNPLITQLSAVASRHAVVPRLRDEGRSAKADHCSAMTALRWWSAFILIALGSVTLLPEAQAVVPAPDGGYPGGNTAEGQNALLSLTNGGFNTAVGYFSLKSDTGGGFNTGVGAGTLLFNNGDSNTAVGTAALLSNAAGSSNTAVGVAALLNNTEGQSNTAVGINALQINNTGFGNTAIGTNALNNNTSALYNTALGYLAGQNATTGSGNVYIGAFQYGSVGEENHTYIRNINGTTVSGGGTDYVTIDLSTGLLGHLSSSRRYKEEIKSMDNASETLYRLKPVTYRFKKEIDTTQSLDYGLIAEDVAKVDPNLAIRDGKGQIESVRYTAINTMLLNEFLKEHRKVEQLEKQVEALAASLQKVTAQIESTQTARQVASRD